MMQAYLERGAFIMVKMSSFTPNFDSEATKLQIGKLIEESRISDKELSDLLGITIQAANRWRHARVLPDLENLFLLAQILGVKVDDFLVARMQKVA